MLGFAMGVCGMSFNDFILLTPFEFQAVIDARTRHDEQLRRDIWESARMQAAISVSPFSRRPVSPARIMPLPWDKSEKPHHQSAPLSKQQALSSLETLISRIRKPSQ